MTRWKSIAGYEEMYAVSDEGEVLSFHKLKPRPHKGGYLTVTLCKENQEPKVYYIHRLVAGAYLENPDDLPQVNHKDKNRRNNCVENLEWCTAKDNNRHAHGVRVAQYDVFGNKLAEYASLIAAEEITCISQSAISHACRGFSRKAGGYIWKYVEE